MSIQPPNIPPVVDITELVDLAYGRQLSTLYSNKNIPDNEYADKLEKLLNRIYNSFFKFNTSYRDLINNTANLNNQLNRIFENFIKDFGKTDKNVEILFKNVRKNLNDLFKGGLDVDEKEINKRLSIFRDNLNLLDNYLTNNYGTDLNTLSGGNFNIELQNFNKNIDNNLIKYFNDLNDVKEKNIKVANTLSKVYGGLSSSINALASGLSNLGFIGMMVSFSFYGLTMILQSDLQKAINNFVDRLADAQIKLTTTILETTKIKTVLDFIQSMFNSIVLPAVNLADMFKNTEISLKSITGSGVLAKNVLNELYYQSIDLTGTFEDLSKIVSSFITSPAIRNQINSLSDMKNILKEALILIQQMSLINPQQGVEGSLVAIQELLGGQTRSLQMRFNLDLSQIEAVLGKSFESVKGNAKDTIEFLSSFFNKIVPVELIYEKTKTISGGFEKIRDIISSSLSFGLQNGYNVFTNFLNNITSSFDKTVLLLQGRWKDLIDYLSKNTNIKITVGDIAFKNLFDNISKQTANIVNKLVNNLEKALENIGLAFGSSNLSKNIGIDLNLFNQIDDPMQKIIILLMTGLNIILTTITAFINKLFGSVESAKQTVEGFINGFKQIMNILSQIKPEYIANIVNLGSSIQVMSAEMQKASAIFQKFSSQITNMILNLMTIGGILMFITTIPSVLSAILLAFNPVIRVLTTALTLITRIGISLFNIISKITSFFTNFTTSISTLFTSLFNGISRLFTTSITNIPKLILGAIASIITGIVSIITIGMSDLAKNIIDFLIIKPFNFIVNIVKNIFDLFTGKKSIKELIVNTFKLDTENKKPTEMSWFEIAKSVFDKIKNYFADLLGIDLKKTASFEFGSPYKNTNIPINFGNVKDNDTNYINLISILNQMIDDVGSIFIDRISELKNNIIQELNNNLIDLNNNFDLIEVYQKPLINIYKRITDLDKNLSNKNLFEYLYSLKLFNEVLLKESNDLKQTISRLNIPLDIQSIAYTDNKIFKEFNRILSYFETVDNFSQDITKTLNNILITTNTLLKISKFDKYNNYDETEKLIIKNNLDIDKYVLDLNNLVKQLNDIQNKLIDKYLDILIKELNQLSKSNIIGKLKLPQLQFINLVEDIELSQLKIETQQITIDYNKIKNQITNNIVNITDRIDEIISKIKNEVNDKLVNIKNRKLSDKEYEEIKNGIIDFINNRLEYLKNKDDIISNSEKIALMNILNQVKNSKSQTDLVNAIETSKNKLISDENLKNELTKYQQTVKQSIETISNVLSTTYENIGNYIQTFGLNFIGLIAYAKSIQIQNPFELLNKQINNTINVLENEIESILNKDTKTKVDNKLIEYYKNTITELDNIRNIIKQYSDGVVDKIIDINNQFNKNLINFYTNNNEVIKTDIIFNNIIQNISIMNSELTKLNDNIKQSIKILTDTIYNISLSKIFNIDTTQLEENLNSVLNVLQDKINKLDVKINLDSVINNTVNSNEFLDYLKTKEKAITYLSFAKILLPEQKEIKDALSILYNQKFIVKIGIDKKTLENEITQLKKELLNQVGEYNYIKIITKIEFEATKENTLRNLSYFKGLLAEASEDLYKEFTKSLSKGFEKALDKALKGENVSMTEIMSDIARSMAKAFIMTFIEEITKQSFNILGKKVYELFNRDLNNIDNINYQQINTNIMKQTQNNQIIIPDLYTQNKNTIDYFNTPQITTSTQQQYNPYLIQQRQQAIGNLQTYASIGLFSLGAFAMAEEVKRRDDVSGTAKFIATLLQIISILSTLYSTYQMVNSTLILFNTNLAKSNAFLQTSTANINMNNVIPSYSGTYNYIPTISYNQPIQIPQQTTSQYGLQNAVNNSFQTPMIIPNQIPQQSGAINPNSVMMGLGGAGLLVSGISTLMYAGDYKGKNKWALYLLGLLQLLGGSYMLASGFGFLPFAEGGIIKGKFTPLYETKAFAEGGIINKPTIGLIGEAGYSEAVIPLKTGYVPVKVEQPQKVYTNYIINNNSNTDNKQNGIIIVNVADRNELKDINKENFIQNSDLIYNTITYKSEIEKDKQIFRIF